MEIDYENRPRDFSGALKWQEQQLEKVLSDSYRQQMRVHGLDEDTYQNLMHMPNLGAGLSDYLVYAVELGDTRFQSRLMHDIGTCGKEIDIRGASLSYEFFRTIRDQGFEGYKHYLEHGEFRY